MMLRASQSMCSKGKVVGSDDASRCPIICSKEVVGSEGLEPPTPSV
jgi:hypothetical protein